MASGSPIRAKPGRKIVKVHVQVMSECSSSVIRSWYTLGLQRRSGGIVNATKMVKPLSQEDFAEIEQKLRQNVDEDRKYWRVNEVKCDAVHTAKTYEEFADRVAAAHLRPLEKEDWKKSHKGWNQYASKDQSKDD